MVQTVVARRLSAKMLNQGSDSSKIRRQSDNGQRQSDGTLRRSNQGMKPAGVKTINNNARKSLMTGQHIKEAHPSTTRPGR